MLALGDRNYRHFCRFGSTLDERFAALGGSRLVDRIECDVDVDAPFAQFRDAVGVDVRSPVPVAVLDPADRVLLFSAVDSRGQVWFTPGGGVHRGESLEAAAVRELAEETGHVRAGAGIGPLVDDISFNSVRQPWTPFLGIVLYPPLALVALTITETELSDMAAAAIIGLSRIPATG